MKILIMGGAGMIGQKLLNLILNKGELRGQKIKIPLNIMDLSIIYQKAYGLSS